MSGGLKTLSVRLSHHRHARAIDGALITSNLFTYWLKFSLNLENYWKRNRYWIDHGEW